MPSFLAWSPTTVTQNPFHHRGWTVKTTRTQQLAPTTRTQNLTRIPSLTEDISPLFLDGFL